MEDSFSAAGERLDEAALAAMAERLERIPLDEAEWVVQLYLECQRARAAEARLAANSPGAGDHPGDPASALDDLEEDLAQIVLDTAEWLRTLWNVGYMGASQLPAQPRSAFPAVEVEDVLKSKLLARIRQGKRPLPFPPPTRWGLPWHEVVEEDGVFPVAALVVADPNGSAVCCTIEGCPTWDIKETCTPERDYLVQFQGKGPLYRLCLDSAGGATLTREPPRWTRQIVVQDRAGIRAFVLEWPKDDGSLRRVPLRAASPERALTEAAHWVASQHPEMYGQVSFALPAE